MNHSIFYANNKKLSFYVWEDPSTHITGNPPHAVLQIVHDYFDHASRYNEFAQYMARHGIVVVAHDLRGHGYTSSLSSFPTMNLISPPPSLSEPSNLNSNNIPLSFPLPPLSQEMKNQQPIQTSTSSTTLPFNTTVMNVSNLDPNPSQNHSGFSNNPNFNNNMGYYSSSIPNTNNKYVKSQTVTMSSVNQNNFNLPNYYEKKNRTNFIKNKDKNPEISVNTLRMDNSTVDKSIYYPNSYEQISNTLKTNNNSSNNIQNTNPFISNSNIPPTKFSSPDSQKKVNETSNSFSNNFNDPPPSNVNINTSANMTNNPNIFPTPQTSNQGLNNDKTYKNITQPFNYTPEVNLSPKPKINNNNSSSANPTIFSEKQTEDIYSSSYTETGLSGLGYEKGNMFHHDIVDTMMINSYCRRRYGNCVPYILLGVGYGSMIAQAFIENNKHINKSKDYDIESTSYGGSSHIYQPEYLFLSKKQKRKLKKKEKERRKYEEAKEKAKKKRDKKKTLDKKKKREDQDIYNFSEMSTTLHNSRDHIAHIDGFILCSTNYMKGILYRTNEFYSNILYLIKGEAYPTNFFFYSMFQIYKMNQTTAFHLEDEIFNGNSDGSSSSSSSSSSNNNNNTSLHEYDNSVKVFGPTQLRKQKPIGSWYTRDPKELLAVQQDSFCNFCYSVNFYQSLLRGVKRLYQRKKANKINTKVPILILAGENDPLGNYSKGPIRLYKFFKEYGVVNVKLFIYERARHALLFENNKVEIYHDIQKWLNDYIFI